ncbi:MAG TPA: glutamine synthetase family protein [Rhizomicrobium sp.]|jgi:glutamine synthetase|nr:glutamine synthetase family protein [Rhizomicrobium sp.]
MNKPIPTPVFSRPAFVEIARKEFEALIARRSDLAFVDALLVDLCGTLRGKRMPVGDAAKLFESGMQIPLSVYLMDMRGEMTNPFGRGFGDGDPDGTAWPIPGTLSPVWGETPKRAQILMTLHDAHGAPCDAEPRAALERVLERFTELKLTPVAALELEYYLIDRERGANGVPLPPRDPQSGTRESVASVYGIDDLNRYRDFLAALTEAAGEQNLPVSAVSKEYAPGQFETNLRHQTNARSAADHAVFLKQVIKAAAAAHGFEASFMAKPYPDKTGSGLHVHVSVLDETGRNIFDDGTAEGSPRLRHAIGGLQALMAESMALFAPNVNSYRRFQPDMFAPVNRRWAVNNRSVGLRIPLSPGDARRVEHRVAGADANPYLVLAGVLAGIHHGLSFKLDSGPAATGNATHEPDLALPFDIEAALMKLSAATTLGSYLGDQMLALYRETKRIEMQRFRRIISEAEYEWYL